VVRGVGYAVGLKNLAFSEGFDDHAEARVRLTADGVEVHTAAVEVGQGLVTVLAQIARTVTGIERVEVVFDHTGRIGSAGSTSASRQTQMAGNAVIEAAGVVRSRALAAVGGDHLDDAGVWRDGEVVATLAELTAEGPIEHHVRYRHRPTDEPDEDGQGDLHVDFCVAAHRAVVDVDPDLGLVRVVQVAIAQDVGRAINPQQVLGQIEGGIAQGLGQAVLEEVVVEDGVVRNPSFTDYLLPTILDVPPVEAVLVEEPSPWGPFGAKGMAELPTISATPAVVAAIRDATGRALTRVPVRPEDIVGTPTRRERRDRGDRGRPGRSSRPPPPLGDLPVGELRPRDLHRTLPGYAVTPLHQLDDLAERLGVGGVWVKDESWRLELPSFKILGGSWAVHRLLLERAGRRVAGAGFDELRAAATELGPLTLATATDGNHGRGVARTARLLGLAAVVYVPAGTASARIAAIEEEGAQVVVDPGNYDAAVARAAAEADRTAGCWWRTSPWATT
jgi:hypothetical protein